MKNKHFLVFVSVLCIVFLLSSSLFAQSSKIKVDGNIIKSYIEYMSTDEQLGRKPMTPEFNKALEWAADKFREWGLKPAGDDGTYFQTVPLTGSRSEFVWALGTPELKISDREFYIRDDDFSVDQNSTAGKTITGEIVFAGYGISAPEKGLDEYAGVDVRNKIVVIFKGSPSSVKQPSGRFGGGNQTPQENITMDIWRAESTDQVKIATAYEKGASGVMIYNPDPDPGYRYRSNQREETPVYTRPFIVLSSIDESVFKWIMNQDPQESTRGYTNRMVSWRLDIKDKKTHSMNMGITASIKGYDSSERYGEKYGTGSCRNIIAKIEGTDRRLKNQFVIIGGHYDHVGVRDGFVRNGADDNASGSAVTMELARLLSESNYKPKRTLIFCLWTAEEMGLIGSYYFSSTPPEGINIANTVAYINMDMVGLGETIGAPGALNFPEIWDVMLKDQDQDILGALRPSTGGPGGSDHSGFITQGIETLAIMTRGGAGHPNYHNPEDDTEFIDPEILRKTGQFVLQAMCNLANEKNVNLIIPDRQHIYDGLIMNLVNINVDLNMERSWKVIDATEKHRLLTLAREKALELKAPNRNTQSNNRYGRRSRGSDITQGIGDIKVFEGCVGTMSVVHALLDFGRADFKGDDGYWLANGLTDKGEMALKYLETNGVAVNLIDPTPESLNSMLDKSTKSFLITGNIDLTNDLVKRINDKGVVVTVDFDPTDVDGCVTKLEEMKNRFGGTDNFLLYLKSTDNLDEAKKDLYLKLFKKGWTKNDIYAIAGVSTSGRREPDNSNLGKLGK
ncbi:MAG: M20/M25/M40 family metallo-hydrolase [bacterium]|nr:M20/M25/M40 family metallo-hydrolase [bacterium]